ncbi:hypothetical protein FALBO_17299 [Fusarium albosuccineum]|uniref:C2H2-type domain-containing protein n=1 Tax=Fusarium albosuccineum TaxID=1237068 RepID=A0A8H4K2F6_9HYPO|nr:hypothetical protein FALBO_17299 [Fusarium albosuccineum]
MESTTLSTLELASHCLAKFDETLSIPALTHKEWAENRRADFNLWVDGVGAMAKKKASLDARFESRWRELALTQNLLLRLSAYLEDYLDAEEREVAEEAKANVDAAIENLASIALAIRRTGLKSRLIKADKNFDPITVDDLRMHLECIIRIRPPPPDNEDQEYDQKPPLWWQVDMNRALTPLQQRLIQGNLQRRNRFLYAQRHSDKLAYRGPSSTVTGNRATGSKPSGTKKVASAVDASQQLDHDGHKQPHDPTKSGTSAPVPVGDFSWEEGKGAFQTLESQITSIASTARYPKLAIPRRSLLETDDEDSEQPKVLKCPCCCQALPIDIAEGNNAWKKHLSMDICPYTCVADACPTPYVLYSTRAEWERHVKKQHPKKWKCQICNMSVFSAIENLVEHYSSGRPFSQLDLLPVHFVAQ